MKAHSTLRQLHDDIALRDARTLWHAARYADCVSTLRDAPPSHDRFLLAATAFYRLRQFKDALRELDRGYPFLQTIEAQPYADALSAVLHECCGNQRESDVFYERALQGGLNIPASASNMLALRSWMRNEHVECLRQLRNAERSWTNPNEKAYTISIRSWLLASQGDLARQASLLEQTIETTFTSEEPDMGLVASALQTLSLRCREMYLPKQHTFANEAYEKTLWSNDTRVAHYNALRNLAWCDALLGRYVPAIRQLTKCREMAPNQVLRAVSILDCAWTASASGEAIAAEAYLNDALEILETVNWDRSGEECIALVLAAELCADADPKAAMALLDQYLAVAEKISALFGVRHHNANKGIAAFARAVLLSKLADVSTSRHLAKEAYEIFDNLGYAWRAARCALFLYEAGCGDKWLEIAKEKAQNYPRSFVGARLQRIESDLQSDGLAGLTPRQREIVKRLCAGESPERIAHALGTTKNTVRVHIQRAYRVLGVNSRLGLIARAGGAKSEDVAEGA